MPPGQHGRIEGKKCGFGGTPDCDHYLLAGHAHPDRDAIGTLIAMGTALDCLGKRQTYDAAVVLDCGDLSRTGTAADRMGTIPLIVNIGHHQTNTRFDHLNPLNPKACTYTEVILQSVAGL